MRTYIVYVCMCVRVCVCVCLCVCVHALSSNNGEACEVDKSSMWRGAVRD